MQAFILIEEGVEETPRIIQVFDHNPSEEELVSFRTGLTEDKWLRVSDWIMRTKCRCIKRAVEGICPVHPSGVPA